MARSWDKGTDTDTYTEDEDDDTAAVQMRKIGEIGAANTTNVSSVTLADRGVVSWTSQIGFQGLYIVYIILHRGCLPSSACSWCTDKVWRKRH